MISLNEKRMRARPKRVTEHEEDLVTAQPGSAATARRDLLVVNIILMAGDDAQLRCGPARAQAARVGRNRGWRRFAAGRVVDRDPDTWR